MRVNPIDNTPFQSRNKTIRFADDIARRVNKCYPRISASKLICFENSLYYNNYIDNLAFIIRHGMRFMKDEMYDNSESFYEKIKALIKPVERYRLGNCGESAQLAAITAKINGIKNCHITHLYSASGEDIDHAVLYVNDKKPYIIDAWLGFADYVPNILSRYKNEYNYNFYIEQDEKITFCSKIDDEYTDFLKDDFTRKQTNKLRKIYPNLFIKRGYV